MIKTEDLLGKLKQVKIDNGPKNVQRLDKNALIKEFTTNFEPKTSDVSRFLHVLSDNKDLSNDTTSGSFWTPRTSIKEIQKKILTESALDRNTPNVFRLNIETIVLDKMHGKFKISRGRDFSIVELLYPNANGKITVRFEIDGMEDRIVEVGLEDEEYTQDFSKFIIKNIDSMLTERAKIQPNFSQDSTTEIVGTELGTNTSSFLKNNSPIWEAIALVEADEKEGEEKPEDEVKVDVDPTIELNPDAETAFDSNINAEGGTEFGPSDFSFGGSGPSGLGAGFMDSDSFNDVNKDSGTVSKDGDAPEYMEFREKGDWLNSALITMQKLVAADVSKKMQGGSGVVLTQDEIMNGMPGIKGDSNYEIVDKFLKIYKELDGIQIPLNMLEQIEDKLSLDDGQFDSWLQAKLPEITGSSDVDETLGNEMFDEFKPMGGETEQPKEEQSIDDFLKSVKETGDTKKAETPEDLKLREKAEEKVGPEIKNQFPNLT